MKLGIVLREMQIESLSLGSFLEESPSEVRGEDEEEKRGHTARASSRGQVLAKCFPHDISLTLPTAW